MCTGAEILAVAGAVKGVGKAATAFTMANDYEDRASDILASSINEMRQSSKGRERARGRLRAAYAKSGVTMTGTAKIMTQEQIRQDEMELLKERYNSQLKVSSEYQKAGEARTKGLMSLIEGAASLGGLRE